MWFANPINSFIATNFDPIEFLEVLFDNIL